ncbi:QcrA and Rieske domain-containing protein [Mariniluteicoccus flavus]
MTDRRTVIKGAGAAAVAVGTAACVGCGGQPSGQRASTAKRSTSGPITVPKANVAVGNGVVLEKAYVVTQPEAGSYKAFTKACPHQGCSVSLIKNKQIVCACHGSEFSIADGARTAGPAKTGLTEVPVKVDGDNLVIG